MGNHREILRLLHRRRREQSKAGRADRHDVAVIAEDRQRMRGDRARRDMKDRRRQLACNLEHVRDHQQQPLARRKRRRERAALQGTVHCARRAPFALHLHHGGNRAPQVRPAGR